MLTNKVKTWCFNSLNEGQIKKKGNKANIMKQRILTLSCSQLG